MLRRSLPCRFDQFREAQRPIEAAFNIKDAKLRLSAMQTVAKICANKPFRRGTNDVRRNPKEANALLLAALSYCRSNGGWREAIELAKSAHTNYDLPLKKEWIGLCLEGATTLEDRQLALEGLSNLYGALPAELFSSSSTQGAKLLFGKGDVAERRAARLGGGGGGRGEGDGEGRIGGASSKAALDVLLSGDSTSDALATLTEGAGANPSPASGALALATSFSEALVSAAKSAKDSQGIASAHHFLQTSPQSLASLPTVNPSFVSYITQQGIVKSPLETQLMISALTGRPMVGLRSASTAAALAVDGSSDADPHAQESLFMRRPVVVRINRSNAMWRAVRELLRRQVPFLVPLQWYPDELAWVVVHQDLTETGAENELASQAAGSGSTTDRHRLRRLRAAQMTRLKHLLQTLVDEGLLSFQSAASMMPAVALCGHLAVERQRSAAASASSSSYKILDMCAAPGGKAQQVIDLLISQQQQQGGVGDADGGADDGNGAALYKDTLVVANDADERRLKAMRGRLGGKNAFVAFTHFSADQFPLPATLSEGGGGGGGESSASQQQLFDGVLLDAPCTGEGRMHRDAQGWRSWHPRNCLGFHTMQLKALKRAIAATREGGVVIYSTCTMNPIENEAVVSAVVGMGLADVVPIMPRTNRKGQSDNTATTANVFDGTIPDQLTPFVSKGLTNWGVPLPNGDYVRPVDHSSSSHTDGSDARRGGGTAFNFTQYDHNRELGGASRANLSLPKGIAPSMVPLQSVSLAKMVANACVRFTPFPRNHDGGEEGGLGRNSSNIAHDQKSRKQLDQLNQMESFFMCKLIVKLSPQERARLVAELNHEDESNHVGRGGGRAAEVGASSSSSSSVYTFKNAKKFSLVDNTDLMNATALINAGSFASSLSSHASSPSAASVVDTHAAARCTLAHVAKAYGIPSMNALLKGVGVATRMSASEVQLAVRPMLAMDVGGSSSRNQQRSSSSSSSTTIYDVYAMSAPLAKFLTSSWASPSNNSSHSRSQSSNAASLQHHHYQTVKKGIVPPDQQQLLSPGTCLFSSVVSCGVGGRTRTTVIPTEEGCAAIAAAAATATDTHATSHHHQPRILDVPVEFLQHLMAMHQPIPEALLQQSESDDGRSNSNSSAAEESLFMLSCLIARLSSMSAASSSATTASAQLSSDAQLPFPSMLLKASSFADPRFQMIRKMRNTEGALGKNPMLAGTIGGGGGGEGEWEEAPWLTQLLGQKQGNASSSSAAFASSPPSSSSIAGPIVLNVRIPLQQRKHHAGMSTRQSMNANSILLSLPAIVVPMPSSRPSPAAASSFSNSSSSSLNVDKLMGLSAPGEAKAKQHQQQLIDDRKAFIALTCRPDTLTQLAALLQRVLGSAMNGDTKATRALLAASTPDGLLTGRGASLEVDQGGAFNNYMSHIEERRRGKLYTATIEEHRMLNADASVKPIIDASMPLAVKASMKHLAAIEEGRKKSGQQQQIGSGSDKRLPASVGGGSAGVRSNEIAF